MGSSGLRHALRRCGVRRREFGTFVRGGCHQVRHLDAPLGPRGALGYSPQAGDRVGLRRAQPPGGSRGRRQEVPARGRPLRSQIRDRRGRRHRQPAHRQGRVKYVSILGGAVAKANEEAVNEAGVLGLTLAYAEGLVSPKNPLTFQCFPAPPETTTFWKWIKDHQPQIKRVASIAPNDDTGWWSVKVETTFVQKLGYAVVAKEFFERSMMDLNPILLRMLAQKPDAIRVIASPAGSVGLIVKQARELGFKGRFVALHQIDSSVVAGIAGRENTEGMWVHGYVQTPLPDKLKSWQQRYTKKFGEWNATSVDFTNPAFAFVAAIKKAQSLDQKKIGEAMRTVEFDNLWGKAHFGGKDYYGVGQQIIYPMPFSEVRDGVATLLLQLTPPHN